LLLFWLVRRSTPGLLDAPVANYRMRELWQQALPVYLTRLLRIFNGRLELLLLGAIGISSDVGVYAVALQVGMVGATLTESLITVTMPLLSGAHHRGGEDALRPLVKTVSRWCLTATLPYYAALVLFADPILNLFGREFGDGREGLLLLGALPLLNSAAGIAAEALAMTGNARLNTFNSIAYLALTLSLDLALIPSQGISGAAAAVVIATFVLNGLRTVQVRWIFGFWPLDIHVGKPLLASFLAGLVGYAARLGLDGAESMTTLAIGGTAVAITYAVSLFALGASEQDRHVIDAIARKLPILERLTSSGRRSD
jgi:O-antigen/teichoic acid export membrane protein